MSNTVKIDINNESNNLSSFFPLESSGHTNIFNFEGRMHYFCDANRNVGSYVQIFRNGIIETVNSYIVNSQQKIIYGKDIEKSIKNTIDSYICSLKRLGITFPFYISVSLLNVKGFRIQSTNQTAMNIIRSVWGDFGGIYNYDIVLPTMYVEKEDNLDNVFAECFNVFWNTDGFPCSPH